MPIEDLLKLLNDRSADYMIIGAQACAAHGYVRATADLDILINPTIENIAKVRSALEAFGFNTLDATLEDFQTKKVLFRQYWFDVDIHPSATGIDTQKALQKKHAGLYEGVATHFTSLEDLIQMKKAAGRPQDLEDLRHLEEIRKQSKK